MDISKNIYKINSILISKSKRPTSSVSAMEELCRVLHFIVEKEVEWRVCAKSETESSQTFQTSQPSQTFQTSQPSQTFQTSHTSQTSQPTEETPATRVDLCQAKVKRTGNQCANRPRPNEAYCNVHTTR